MGDETILNTALEISEKRAEIQRRMRTAILSDDLRSALHFACQLVGIGETEAAAHVELLPVSEEACTI